MSNERDSKLKASSLLSINSKNVVKVPSLKLGDKQVEDVEVISTGSLGLDIALGIGDSQRKDHRDLWP